LTRASIVVCVSRRKKLFESDVVAAQQRHGAMGHEETSIVRLNDAAIVDGAIMAAVGLLLEYRS
jgi:hypothetical protein